MKICIKCGIEKDESCYFFRKDSNKYRNECKDCKKIYDQENKEQISKNQKKNYQKNKEQILKYHKEYYQENKEEIVKKKKIYRKENEKRISKYHKEYNKKNKEQISKQQKEYYEENKEQISKQQKEYYQENKEQNAKRHQEYYQKNKEKINKQSNKWCKERKETDPAFKLKTNVSKSINKMLKVLGSAKNRNSIIKYLEYTFNELKQHIESLFEPWMNWKNYGKYNLKTWDDNDPSTWTWQLDHIIPHSEFKYTSMDCEEFRRCWALENLRPYSAKQNILDGVNRIRHKKKA